MWTDGEGEDGREEIAFWHSFTMILMAWQASDDRLGVLPIKQGLHLFGREIPFVHACTRYDRERIHT